jgi:hypothetical protein
MIRRKIILMFIVCFFSNCSEVQKDTVAAITQEQVYVPKDISYNDTASLSTTSKDNQILKASDSTATVKFLPECFENAPSYNVEIELKKGSDTYHQSIVAELSADSFKDNSVAKSGTSIIVDSSQLKDISIKEDSIEISLPTIQSALALSQEDSNNKYAIAYHVWDGVQKKYISGIMGVDSANIKDDLITFKISHLGGYQVVLLAKELGAVIQGASEIVDFIPESQAQEDQQNDSASDSDTDQQSESLVEIDKKDIAGLVDLIFSSTEAQQSLSLLSNDILKASDAKTFCQPELAVTSEGSSVVYSSIIQEGEYLPGHTTFSVLPEETRNHLEAQNLIAMEEVGPYAGSFKIKNFPWQAQDTKYTNLKNALSDKKIDSISIDDSMVELFKKIHSNDITIFTTANNITEDKDYRGFKSYHRSKCVFIGSDAVWGNFKSSLGWLLSSSSAALSLTYNNKDTMYYINNYKNKQSQAEGDVVKDYDINGPLFIYIKKLANSRLALFIDLGLVYSQEEQGNPDSYNLINFFRYRLYSELSYPSDSESENLDKILYNIAAGKTSTSVFKRHAIAATQEVLSEAEIQQEEAKCSCTLDRHKVKFYISRKYEDSYRGAEFDYGHGGDGKSIVHPDFRFYPNPSLIEDKLEVTADNYCFVPRKTQTLDTWYTTHEENINFDYIGEIQKLFTTSGFADACSEDKQ